MSKDKEVIVYPESFILDAIGTECLAGNAWGYKTNKCIYVCKDGQENEDLWKDIKPSMEGWENATWDFNELEAVNYYLIKRNE